MLRGFSWKQGICCFSTVVPRHHASALIFRICLENQPTRLNRDNRRPANIAFSAPLRSNTKYRNINLFPIDYAFRPRLRGRLTLPRLTLHWNPPGLPASWLFTRFIVTYVSIRTSDTSSMPHSTPSQAPERSPTQQRISVAAAASVHGLAPLHLPRRRLDQ